MREHPGEAPVRRRPRAALAAESPAGLDRPAGSAFSGCSSLLRFGLRLRCPPTRARPRDACQGRPAAAGAPPQSTHMNSHTTQPPQAVGLYDPRFEHDACGVGMVARLDNEPTHEVITRALDGAREPRASRRLGRRPVHRRRRRDPDADARRAAALGRRLRAAAARRLRRADVLPAQRRAGPRPRSRRCSSARSSRRASACSAGARCPIDPTQTGEVAAACRPVIRQLFVGAGPSHESDQDAFERKLYVIRRMCELTAQEPGLYVASSSSRTINYKGMLISYQLARLLRRPARRAHEERARARALALLDEHVPELGARASLPRDLPQRRDQHGDGQRQLDARPRERAPERAVRRGPAPRSSRSSRAGNSDSATFDNVLELLMLAGRSLPHAAMMMIPEAYRDREDLPDHLKGFYAFHSCLMEPWDGPAAVAFTDGRVVGATLDRNGLRPGRWVETTDGYVVLGSESGLLDIPPENVRRLGRLQPGKLFLVDLERGRIVEDEEVKREVATRQPYGEWYARNAVHFSELPPSEQVTLSNQPLHLRQRAFGYTQEDLRVLLAPMAIDGAEPVGSMGNDLSLAVLSDQAPPLFSYFKQLFAQVTNPPIDPIREEIVMSLATSPRQRAQPLRRDARARAQAAARPADPAQPRARDAAQRRPRRLQSAQRSTSPGPSRRAPRAWQAAIDRALPPGARGDRGGREHHHPLRPQARARARADPLAAGGRGGAPPPRARGDAAARRHHRRVGRAARGPPLRDADRLRRERDQPLRRARDARPDGRRRPAGAAGEDGGRRRRAPRS